MVSALIDVLTSVALVGGGMLLFADPGDPVPALRVMVVAVFCGLALLELATGRTPGKVVTRTRVVDGEGNRPSSRQILDRRTFSGRVVINAYSLFRELRPRHDRLSGTYVVRDGD